MAECRASFAFWSVPSIQHTHLQPHQSPTCRFAQTASMYLLYWLYWLSKSLPLKMHIWCLNWFPAPPANGCSEVMDIFSANHSDNCMIRVIGSRSEGSSSSHQMCSHVEIITCLLAVFILRHTDWIITYSSFAQRHYCDMQMLIVMDLVPWTKYYCCSYRISQCSQQSASWEDETEIARPHIHIYGSEHSVWQTWLFYPRGFELLINNHIALSANRNSCWPRYSGPFGPSTLYKQGVCRDNHKCTFYSSNY